MRRRPPTVSDLKVALVHDWLTVPAGSEAVFEQMCDLFPGEVFASIIDTSRNKFLEKLPLHHSPIQYLPLARTKHYLYAPFMPWAYARFDLRQFDLVLSDSHSFAHAVKRRPDAIHINYYHTPARSLWMPEIDPRASLTPIHRWIAKQLRAGDLRASKHPDIVFANSNTTAERIRKFYGRKVEQVIYPPVDTAAWLNVQRRSESEGLLYWGRLIRYKRVDLAIEAAKEAGERLHVVGSGPMEEELKELAHKIGANVLFWGRLPQDQLLDLAASCRAVVFPGYEDFGIVPVEAMAAGLPVVAYGEGGVTESVKPEFGVLFAEQTPISMAHAIADSRTKGYEIDAMKNHARSFDVSRFREIYKEAVLNAIEQRLPEVVGL